MQRKNWELVSRILRIKTQFMTSYIKKQSQESLGSSLDPSADSCKWRVSFVTLSLVPTRLSDEWTQYRDFRDAHILI